MNQDKMQDFEYSEYIGTFLNCTIVIEGHSVIVVQPLTFFILKSNSSYFNQNQSILVEIWNKLSIIVNTIQGKQQNL